MVVTTTVASLALHACGGGGGGGGPSNTSDPCEVASLGSANAAFSAAGIFNVSPILIGAISFITPLGNLNPPNAHVYPTDHMFLLPTNTAAGANVVSAAAAGKIVQLFQPAGAGGDWKMVVQVDSSFVYYYDHITPAGGVAVGSTLNAGQAVGTNSGAAAAVDFGVYNFNNPPLTGILNACALKGVAYVDSPLKYYSGALQTTLYGKVNVSGAATRDGKIDYDQSGRLVGNWVLTGHQPFEPPAYALAFTYDVANHELRVSAGSQLSGGGLFAVQSGAPDFASITQASAQVNYRLYSMDSSYNAAPGAEYGVLAVQLISPSRIKVQIFPGNLSGTATFDANALLYDR